MRQLRNIEEVRRQTAHQLTCTVAVVIVKAQLLHMPEQIPANVRLHQDAEGMAVVANDVREQRPQKVGGKHHRHHCKKGSVRTGGQQLVHTPAGNCRERQINERNGQCTAKVQNEQLPVRFEIRQKNLQRGFLLKLSCRHSTLLFSMRI